VENHIYAVAIHVMHYHFCRVYMTTKETPAMSTALADRPWTIADLVALADIESN